MSLASSPAVVAGLILAALPHMSALGLSAPTATAVLEATGVPRTSGYTARSRIQELLPTLERRPGRPATPQVESSEKRVLDSIHQAVLEHIAEHPGCVTSSRVRRRYSQGFQRFVLDTCGKYKQLDLEVLASACFVPMGTLKDWLRGESAQVQRGVLANLTDRKRFPTLSPTLIQLETLLDAWAQWSGGFRPFCEHVQLHLRLPFSRQFISDILESQGVRIPKRRTQPPDADALKEGFITFFPGAQWVGDGSQLNVTIDGQVHTLNFELMVDTHTGALTGASIRPTEDALAVTQAIEDGVQAAGEAPIALLLDNKPSNHCDAVTDTLGEILLLRSRPYQATDKPHVEGGFGLFKALAPELRLNITEPAEIASQLASFAITLWARTLNHKPRTSREGLSRIQLYAEAPTEEEIQEAKAALQARLQKQLRAQKTRAQRQDPLIRATVEQALKRLGLEDPKGHFLTALASWPLDAILAGIAIFEAKAHKGSLPEGADARYLRGIIKNIAQEEEGIAVAMLLLEGRLKARDQSLDPLQRSRAQLDEQSSTSAELIVQYIDHALKAARKLDRIFWLLCVAESLQEEPPSAQQHLLKVAARRIHSTSSVPHRERLAATRLLFAKTLPLN